VHLVDVQALVSKALISAEKAVFDLKQAKRLLQEQDQTIMLEKQLAKTGELERMMASSLGTVLDEDA